MTKLADRLRDDHLPRNMVMPTRAKAADALDAAENILREAIADPRPSEWELRSAIHTALSKLRRE